MYLSYVTFVMIKFVLVFLFFCLNVWNIYANQVIDEDVYTLLLGKEYLIRDVVRNKNSEILEKVLLRIDERLEEKITTIKTTQYVFLKYVLNKELEERNTFLEIENKNIKIKISLWDKELIAEMENNATAKDFISLLPLTIDFQDYNAVEKVFDLPRKLNMLWAPAGIDPELWDIAYYSPWGNVALYYKDFSYSNGLVLLGRIASWIEELDVEWTINNVHIELIQ